MLKKPIGFLSYDLSDYTKHVGFSHDYKDLTWGRGIENLDDLLTQIIPVKKEMADKINCDNTQLNVSQFMLNYLRNNLV